MNIDTANPDPVRLDSGQPQDFMKALDQDSDILQARGVAVSP